MVLSTILFTGILVWVSALVQHLNTVFSKGPKFALGDRAQALTEDGFTGRAARTLRNNMESALMYVPVTLVALQLKVESNLITLAAIIYLGARVAFTLAYWLKINLLRTASWAIAMAAIATIALRTSQAFLHL